MGNDGCKREKEKEGAWTRKKKRKEKNQEGILSGETGTAAHPSFTSEIFFFGGDRMGLKMSCVWRAVVSGVSNVECRVSSA